ncbi:MAG: light-harvesting protein, partial [Betaproteobacteria bacterium]
MWRYWRIVDPRKAIILTGLLIAFISGTIHLIMISTDRYNLNTWS